VPQQRHPDPGVGSGKISGSRIAQIEMADSTNDRPWTVMGAVSD